MSYIFLKNVALNLVNLAKKMIQGVPNRGVCVCGRVGVGGGSIMCCHRKYRNWGSVNCGCIVKMLHNTTGFVDSFYLQRENDTI